MLDGAQNKFEEYMCVLAELTPLEDEDLSGPEAVGAEICSSRYCAGLEAGVGLSTCVSLLPLAVR